MPSNPTEISILYGSLRGARGTPTKRLVHTVKLHEDVFVDDIGDCKVFSLTLSEDGKLKVIDEKGQMIMVETNKVRPLTAISQYDLKVLRNKVENAKQLAGLGLGPPEPSPNPAKVRKTAARPAAPKPDRTMRSEAAHKPPPVEEAEPPSGEEAEAGIAEEEGVPTDADEEPLDDAATPETTGAATGTAEDKRLEAMLEKVTMKQWRRIETMVDKRFHQIRREINFSDCTKGIRKKQKSSKKGKKQPTKAVRRAQGTQPLWDLHKMDETMDIDDIDTANMVPDLALIDYKLQPFIKQIEEVAFEFFGHGFTPKKLLIEPADAMRLLYTGIELRPPTAQFLNELVNGGIYSNLRLSGNRILRDLKNRYFVRIKVMFKKVVTDDAITQAKVHTTESLYTSPWAPTLSAEYGEFNRGAQVNKPIVLPGFGQHLPVWSEKTLSQNLATGRKSMMLYVGGPILTNFIKELSVKDPEGEGEDVLPKLDALSVFVAYVTAKEHGLALNHGIRIGVAAGEWKNW